eukprot:252613-Karenia_brevis.AAC.1
MLVYRGRGAVHATNKRKGDNGDSQIKLPVGAGAEYMHVVREYKHLGSIISCDGNLVPDARHRAASAMIAYKPISHRIFGSPRIS